MRRAALIVALVVLATTGTARAGVRVTKERKLTARTVELTIDTPAFAAPTLVEVVLPRGYAAHPKRRWPVTYITAGTMNNQNTFRTFVHGEDLAKDYPSIIISPDGNSGYWSDWYNGGAFGPPMYETFVIDQLIPLIDKRFRTRPGRAHRVIFGVSMGGYGTMMFAARHPDRFAAAASLSGAVDSNLPANGAVLSASSTFDGGPVDAIYGPRATQEVRWHGHNPTDLAANLRDVELQVRSANGVPNPGIGEQALSADSVSCVVEGGVYMATVSFHDTLDGLGIEHLYKDYGPGCHTVPNFKREITDTLTEFKRVLADPPARPRRFEYRSIEPHFDIWGWHVDADPARALEFMRVQARRGRITLEGSGRTIVTTPRWYRGRRRVDVNGKPTAVHAGRVRFVVDLGAADTDQQYTPGASTTVTRRTVKLSG